MKIFEIKNAIKDFFNWKKNPKNVFFLALPLFAFGMIVKITEAILQIRQHNDWVYLYTIVGVSILGALGLYHPMRYIWKYRTEI